MTKPIPVVTRWERFKRATVWHPINTDPDDDLWNNYIGPMIDSIEDDYTAIATEIEAWKEQS